MHPFVLLISLVSLLNLWSGEAPLSPTVQPEAAQHQLTVGNVYHDRELGYRIDAPTDWIVEPRPPLPDLKGATTFTSPYAKDDGTYYQVSIILGEHPVSPGMNLARWTELYECTRNIYEHPAYAHLRPWEAGSRTDAAELLYLTAEDFQYIHLLRGHLVWAIEANFGPDPTDQAQQVFEGIVSSFELTERVPQSYSDLFGREPDSFIFPSGYDIADCQPFQPVVSS